jgi:gamma-glutamyl-gamma-aminobutyrate hydrolase PuuD
MRLTNPQKTRPGRLRDRAGPSRAGRARAVLAICRGLQVLNVAAGGTLIQDIRASAATDVNHSGPSSAALAHAVEVVPGSHLDAMLERSAR